jgi:2'-5' RNA ligase
MNTEALLQQVRDRICREYNTGLIVIVPPRPLRDMLDDLIEKYDPVTRKIVHAHITVSNPLREQIDLQSRAKIELSLSDMQPFTIRLGPARTFKKNTVVYLAVDPEKRIETLRTTLHDTGLFEKTMPHGFDFIPHLTICEFGCRTAEQAVTLAEQLNRNKTRGSFDCHEIQLITPDKSCHFTVYRTFPLSRT